LHGEDLMHGMCWFAKAGFLLLLFAAPFGCASSGGGAPPVETAGVSPEKANDGVDPRSIARRCLAGDKIVPDPGCPPLFQSACDQGDSTSCGLLAMCFRDGIVVGKDADRAGALFQKACDAGNPHGCNDSGWMLQYGSGERNVERASMLFRRA